MDNVKCTGRLYNGEVWNPQTYLAMTINYFISDVWGQALHSKHKGFHQGIEAWKLFDCQGQAICSVQQTWEHHGREDSHAVQCGYRVGVKLTELLFDFRQEDVICSGLLQSPGDGMPKMHLVVHLFQFDLDIFAHGGVCWQVFIS